MKIKRRLLSIDEEIKIARIIANILKQKLKDNGVSVTFASLLEKQISDDQKLYENTLIDHAKNEYGDLILFVINFKTNFFEINVNITESISNLITLENNKDRVTVSEYIQYSCENWREELETIEKILSSNKSRQELYLELKNELKNFRIQ
jgi:hypothetical protein